ncbi:dihydroorotase [Clostridium formicaceticum]|uniref:Dihydroorotase n=1 Tax=Clostridium formicaceticum TaxID=1497 RepID=A0AAC9RQC8_9CLOT|nr:dihydroorotase [Clostridium formicaceticum]AOY74868.1 dihydroorotase [Clostridium formicaceticum]ARE89268.1 Dihydroorotase [Clostridium formicaceticum]
MSLLIKNGRVIDPISNIDEVKDVLIKDHRIAAVAKNIEVAAEKVIDAKGCWVVPGLIDVHVHLREPGFEYKETIETGSKSAAIGGFTSICCMPNTNPVIDNTKVVDFILNKASKEAVVKVLPIGTITKGQLGEELAEIKEMVKRGICGISEDGKTVMNSRLMEEALKLAAELNIPVFSHCEDHALAGKGVMNEGKRSRELGIQGIPSASEEVIAARDIALAKDKGAKLHLCHISTKGTVEILKKGKDEGVFVTAEVCPHHFALTEEVVTAEDTNTKMNPPLRSQEDVEAIREALRNGIIDMIATDHAPHHEKDKNTSYEKAAFGIVGLETAVALTITELVEEGILTPMQMIELMSSNPAKLLGIDRGTLGIGKMADITIIDPEETYPIDKNQFVSKAKNTPFHGKKVKGKVKYTIVEGNIIVENGSLIEGGQKI